MALIVGQLDQRFPEGLLGAPSGPSARRGYWQDQLARAENYYAAFYDSGDRVVDKYRIEQNAALDRGRDRYNILYSTTETVRPSLYAQTPKCEATKRHRDRTQPIVEQTVSMIEGVTQYALEEVDFDDVMEQCVEDYLLPGWGCAWVRYTAEFKNETDANGRPVPKEGGEDGEYNQLLSLEGLALDYIHWKDFRTGAARNWREVPWVAKRVYMNFKRAAAAFGKQKAARLAYSKFATERDAQGNISFQRQSVVWEIWDKDSRTVIWYSDDYPDDVIEVKQDPLRLKSFFPCPRPMRAISNTKTMVPRPFYAEYQAQAEELDNLTMRIRMLTNALQVRGVYDGSSENLANLLSPVGGNKMIAVQDWQNFVSGGGIKGKVDWVPISDIVNVLMELYKAREIVRGEIYEITGFSDIVRGLSKASETLGAQQIKSNWSSARLRRMQKEVQRFARDLVRIMSEIICEHFSEETLAIYSGFDIPPPNPQYQMQVQQAQQQYQMQAAQAQMNGQPAPPPPQLPPDPTQQAIQQFRACVALMRNERERCAKIGIETDSTILPDEEEEKKTRMEFLTAAGAYLQQAGPMIQQFPEMREPLMAMMMFAVRSFRAARPLEQTFEQFQQKIMSMPAQQPGGANDNGAAASQAAMQTAQIKVQGDMQKQQMAGQQEMQEAQLKAQVDREKEQNRHAEKERELDIRERELAVKEREIAREADRKQFESVVGMRREDNEQGMRAQQQEHQQRQDIIGGVRQDEQFQAQERRADRQERMAA